MNRPRALLISIPILTVLLCTLAAIAQQEPTLFIQDGSLFFYPEGDKAKLVLIDNDPQIEGHNQVTQLAVFNCAAGTVEIFRTSMHHEKTGKWTHDWSLKSHSVLVYNDDQELTNLFTDICRRVPKGEPQPSHQRNQA